MHREYAPAQKSIDFLNEVMKSSKYCPNAKIFKEKIMDKGLDKEPPYNLSLNKIATTLDAETAQEDDNQDGAFVNSLTCSGTSLGEKKLHLAQDFGERKLKLIHGFRKTNPRIFNKLHNHREGTQGIIM